LSVSPAKVTLSFAKLDQADTIKDSNGGTSESIGPKSHSSRSVDIFRQTSIQPQPGMRNLPVTLPSLAVATVTVPMPMSELDYNALVAALTAWKPALVQTAQARTAAIPAEVDADDWENDDAS
jgi:hypothetical protein